jgi:hypothetical protein
MSGCEFQNKRFSVPMSGGGFAKGYERIKWGKKKKKKKAKMEIVLKG